MEDAGNAVRSEKAIRRQLRKKLGSRVARKSNTKLKTLRSGQRSKPKEKPRVTLARKYREYMKEAQNVSAE